MFGIPEGGKERLSFCIRIEQKLGIGEVKGTTPGKPICNVGGGKGKKTVHDEN